MTVQSHSHSKWKKQINAHEVILVEIHSLNPKQRHLQDKIIQEIIELLRDTVLARTEQLKKKMGQQKNNKEGILTGTSVRVGYSFKNKPGNQICLNGPSLTDEDLSDYRVVQEKLVVYVQSLVEGSPKGMSQILRRLSDVKQSTGSSVSISSYFKKASSSQRSQGQGAGGSDGTTEHKTKSRSLANDLSSASVDPNKPEPVMMTSAPSSGGKRQIIKGILERGRFPGRKRKLKKVPAMVLSDEDSCESAKSVASDKAENNRPITHKEKDSAAQKDSKSDTSTVIVNQDYNESHSFTVRKVDVDQSKSANMLNIAYDPGQDLEKDDENGDKDKGFLDIGENSDKRNDVSSKMETSPGLNEELASLSPKLGRNACLNEEPVNVTPDGSDSSPGSSDDSGVLPSASFCRVSDGRRLSRMLSVNTKLNTILNDILKRKEKREVKGTPEHGSPVFGGKSGSNKALVDEEVDSIDLPEFGHLSNFDGKKNKKLSRIKSLNKFRFKRKLPKFSDSDSEDNFPEKKRQHVLAVTSNINTKGKCKERKELKGKIQFSKDFFSDSKSSTAIQPKLSFFTKAVKKDKQKGINNNDENTDLEPPDLDKGHISETPDSPSTVDEVDSELLQEVRSLSNVESLNEEQIRFLIRRNKSFLLHIFEGKTKCSRHEAYKQGGKSRRNLDYASRLGPYTDEQLDIVMECLIGIFCKKHQKYLDYIMKVLLPEILIKFHMEMNNTTQEESDRLLAPGTPEQVSSSS